MKTLTPADEAVDILASLTETSAEPIYLCHRRELMEHETRDDINQGHQTISYYFLGGLFWKSSQGEWKRSESPGQDPRFSHSAERMELSEVLSLSFTTWDIQFYGGNTSEIPAAAVKDPVERAKAIVDYLRSCIRKRAGK